MKKVRDPLIWQIIGEKDYGLVYKWIQKDLTKPLHWNKAPCCNNMSTRRKRVISTEEIQFNHKPTKMLLAEKRRESAKMAKPQV